MKWPFTCGGLQNSVFLCNLVISKINFRKLPYPEKRHKVIEILDIFISLVIIKQGYILFHAGAILDNNMHTDIQDAVLICGPAGSGKTIEAIKKSGFNLNKILSDDKVFLDKSLNMIPYPRYLLIKYNDLTGNDIRRFCITSNWSKMRMALVDVVDKVLGSYFARRIYFYLFNNLKIPLQLFPGKIKVCGMLHRQDVPTELDTLLLIQDTEFLTKISNAVKIMDDDLINERYSMIIQANREICLKLTKLS